MSSDSWFEELSEKKFDIEATKVTVDIYSPEGWWEDSKDEEISLSSEQRQQLLKRLYNAAEIKFERVCTEDGTDRSLQIEFEPQSDTEILEKRDIAKVLLKFLDGNDFLEVDVEFEGYLGWNYWAFGTMKLYVKKDEFLQKLLKEFGIPENTSRIFMELEDLPPI